MEHNNVSSFCRYLKNGLVYNNNTFDFTISPCCYFSKKFSIDLTQDINKQYIKFRKYLNSISVEEACKICIQAEKNGIVSYRQSSFDLLEDSNKIQFITIAVNKQCNLACPICDSKSSSFWYRENLRHNIPQDEIIKNLHKEDKNNKITNKFLSLLQQQDLSNLKYIKFGGGEPLMSDTHKKILEIVPSPENIIIQYTSNFSIIPKDDVIKLWGKFKLVKWVASIDGIQERFNFLRWPFNWKDFEDNIDNALQLVPSNTMFGIEHTLNALNIFYFDEFNNWFQKKFKFNRYGDESDFSFHPASGIMTLKYIPKMLRSMIEEKYGAVHPIVLLMHNHLISDQKHKMVEYLDSINKHRGTSWRENFSDIEGFF